MTTAIHAEDLGKLYLIGQSNYTPTLRERLNDVMTNPFRRRDPSIIPQSSSKPFWALRDVSFDIEHGASIGLIGHNGSGKSTLLKLLARIMRPTEGRLRVNGRLGSLLEVGIGFHPELSGRENVYLSGSILGMHRAELDRKFDEIVDFSGMEQFLDTPIKFYSSGMYLRLAFSVSIHLDPDILLIDEVFAVGDQEFQRKCLRRLAKAHADGQTMILVSHSMSIIADQCEKVIWLNRGQMVEYGDASTVIAGYMRQQSDKLTTSADWSGTPVGVRVYDPPVGSEEFHLERVYVVDHQGETALSVDYHQPFELVYEYRITEAIENFKIYINIKDSSGRRIVVASTADTIPLQENHLGDVGFHRVRAPLPAAWFRPGSYTIEVGFASIAFNVIFYDPTALSVLIVGPGFESTYDEILHPTLPWQHTHKQAG